ncbi:MAG: ribosome silencing factor [Clostridiales bacterium]|nr:ribosome silencing factor [Clostridiales bacterium]
MNKIVETAYKALDNKKGINIKVIDISKVSVIADYFIIASGSNTKHVKALADNVEDELGKLGYHAKQVEGYNTANWILLDYNDAIIHIFNESDRLFYDLERIWRDGQLIEM